MVCRSSVLTGGSGEAVGGGEASSGGAAKGGLHGGPE